MRSHTTYQEVFSSALQSATRAKKAMTQAMTRRSGLSMVEQEEATFEEILKYESEWESGWVGERALQRSA